VTPSSEKHMNKSTVGFDLFYTNYNSNIYKNKTYKNGKKSSGVY